MLCFQFSAKDNRTSIGSSWGRMKLNSRAGRSARRARSPIWSRQGGRGGYEGGKLAALQHQVCQAQIGNIVRLTLKDLRPNPTESAAQGTDSFRSPCRDVSLLRDSRSWKERAVVATHVNIQPSCWITVGDGGRPEMHYQLRLEGHRI